MINFHKQEHNAWYVGSASSSDPIVQAWLVTVSLLGNTPPTRDYPYCRWGRITKAGDIVWNEDPDSETEKDLWFRFDCKDNVVRFASTQPVHNLPWEG